MTDRNNLPEEGRVKSADLTAGVRLRFKSESRVYTLVRRKKLDEHKMSHGQFHPGWWVEGGGGFADFVLDGSDDWEVVE